MLPQFVDFDGDGNLDIVTATFDGSPHLALGDGKSFAQPERMHDAEGRRILLGMFWNYDTEEWDEVEDGARGASKAKDQLTSAVAFDWDADGDFDLLLGDYNNGRLYLQRNEGKAGEPKFTGANEPVLAGGKPFATKAKLTSPNLVDWNGDGLTDVLYGTYGDCWGDEAGGGVYVLLNEGKVGEPVFGAPITLIRPEKKAGLTEPTRPDAGLYADAVDFDGDGDLDLLVGAYSMWKPEQPELSEEQAQRADELAKEVEGLGDRIGEMQSEALEGLDGDDIQTAFEELRQSEEYRSVQARLSAATEELQALRPPRERQAGVWWYERIAP